jgi:hypothetical protein
MQTGLDLLLWFLGIFLIILPHYFLIRWFLYKRKWTYIETVNQRVGITRENAYLDNRGYLRWRSDKVLCHRDIAFRELDHAGLYFSEYDVHHQNENKLDNNPENLQILTRERHQLAHGEIIYELGRKYIRLCRDKRISRHTPKAIFAAAQWIPRSQTLIRDRYLYVANWLVKERGLCKRN